MPPIKKLLDKLLGPERPRIIEKRAPRVVVSARHNVRFESGSRQRPFKSLVKNISISGVALFNASTPADIKSGGQEAGTLFFPDSNFDVQLELRHRDSSLAGFRFLTPDEPLVSTIRVFFEMEILGLGLKKIPDEFVQKNPMGAVQWFTDPHGNELYIVEKDGTVLSFHLTFLGNYVEGRGDQVRFGHIKDDGDREGHFPKPSSMVEFESGVPAELPPLISRLLGNVPGLSDALRAQIAGRIKNSVSS